MPFRGNKDPVLCIKSLEILASIIFNRDNLENIDVLADNMM